jgi:hypothetical protein
MEGNFGKKRDILSDKRRKFFRVEMLNNANWTK